VDLHQEDEMDEYFLQLSELARAGWSLQIHPEPDAPTLPATRAVILWSYAGNPEDPMPDEPQLYPLIDWINLFAPETEMRKAVAKMHAWVFRIPPFGSLTA
jgi:hypothetical protein